MFDPFFIFTCQDCNHDVVKKMFMLFWIFARSDPPEVFFLLPPQARANSVTDTVMTLQRA